MSTDAFSADGAIIRFGNTIPCPDDPSSETSWTEMKGVTDFDGPGAGKNQIECTELRSPNNEPEYVDGRKTRDVITFNMNWNRGKAYCKQLLSDCQNGVLRCLGIEWDNTEQSYWLGRVRIESIRENTRGGDVTKAVVTCRPTGLSIEGDGYDWS